jgi:hypothetical protein
MAERDRVATDEHLFDDEPEDLLPLAHVQGLRARPQRGAEPGERLGEVDVTRLIHSGKLQPVEFRGNGARLSLIFRDVAKNDKL